MNLFYRTYSINREEDIFVVVDKWLSLTAVHRHAVTNDIFSIIRASARKHTFDNSIFINLEFDDGVEFNASFGEHFFKGISLLYRTGETIKKKTILGISVI